MVGQGYQKTWWQLKWRTQINLSVLLYGVTSAAKTEIDERRTKIQENEVVRSRVVRG